MPETSFNFSCNEQHNHIFSLGCLSQYSFTFLWLEMNFLSSWSLFLGFVFGLDLFQHLNKSMIENWTAYLFGIHVCSRQAARSVWWNHLSPVILGNFLIRLAKIFDLIDLFGRTLPLEGLCSNQIIQAFTLVTFSLVSRSFVRLNCVSGNNWCNLWRCVGHDW